MPDDIERMPNLGFNIYDKFGKGCKVIGVGLRAVLDSEATFIFQLPA